jgi:hypothetical protein
MTGDELEIIVTRLLEEGVPHLLLARVFDIDPDVVKEVQSSIRVSKYGTDDMTDYLEQLQWKTVDEMIRLMETGSTAEKIRLASTVLGRQMVAAAKRTPADQRDARDNLLEALADMRGKGNGHVPPPSPFIAKLEGNA